MFVLTPSDSYVVGTFWKYSFHFRMFLCGRHRHDVILTFSVVVCVIFCFWHRLFFYLLDLHAGLRARHGKHVKPMLV